MIRPRCPGVVAGVLAVATLVANVSVDGQSRADFAEGSAVLAGLVTDAQTSAPIEGASVALNALTRDGGAVLWPTGAGSVNLPGNRTVVTGEDGRFRFTALQPGRYLLMVHANDYQGGSRATLTIAAGENREDVHFRLMPAGRITGAVLDDRNEPVAGANVRLWRREVVASKAVWKDALGTSPTDDRGMFRFEGIRPGDYLVAVSHERPGDTGDSIREWVFYPSSSAPESASVITLRAGESRTAIVVTVPSAPEGAGSVVGVIRGGPPTAEFFEVRLERLNGPAGIELVTRTNKDRTFMFSGVVPGLYRVSAWLVSSAGSLVTATSARSLPRESIGQVLPAVVPATTWAASRTIAVSARRSDLSLELRPGARVVGRVVSDGAEPLPANGFAGVPVIVWPVGRSLGPMPVGGIGMDGQFVSVGLPPGLYQLWVGLPIVRALSEWYVGDVQTAGQRVSLIEMGTDDVQILVTLTKRPTELKGVVLDRNKRPVEKSAVIVFSQDQSSWAHLPAVRLIADGQGEFAVKRFRAGNYYVAAVRSTSEEWRTGEYLSSLVARATPVHIELGERRSLTLTVTD